MTVRFMARAPCSGLTVMLIQPDAFGPEALAVMGEALDAACKEQGEAARETIARRIVAAARFGECDPLRLREAALTERRS
jgi:hypothetical protein